MQAGFKDLTPRQVEVLAWIRGYIRSKLRPPTVRELMEAFDIKSPNGAICHLRALARKGAIKVEPGTSRGIRLAEDEDPGVRTLLDRWPGLPAETRERILSLCAGGPTA